jgi:hypothetical protein
MRIIWLAACLCTAFVLQPLAWAQAPAAIRIGILNDQAGPYADFGGKTSVTAAQMAVGPISLRSSRSLVERECRDRRLSN